MTKPVKVSFLGDISDLASSLGKGGAALDDFAADAVAAGGKAERSLSGVADKADSVGSASSQAAGGIGDLGGALALMPGPLAGVGAGMEVAGTAIMGVTGAADLLNLATTKFPALAKLQTAATNAMASAQKALNLVMAGNPIALLVLAIVALIAVFAVLYAKNERFRELVNAVFGALKDKLGGAIARFVDFASTARDKLGAAGERLGDLRDNAANAIGSYRDGGGGVLGKFYAMVSAVGNLPGIVRDKAAGLFAPVREAADNAVGTYGPDGGGALGRLYKVVSVLTGIGGTIRTKAAGMWDGIKESFRGVINSMIGWWNALSFSIDIPNKIPGLPDSFSISTPNIPYLASGGIVTRPTLAVVGEAGPEAVIPLSRLGGLGGVVKVDLRLSAQQLDRLSRGREIQADLDFYRQNGGRAYT